MSIVKQLRQGCRHFKMPAELALENGETLLCAEMLRLLPGKRAVMKAQWRGRPVLVKLMLNTASGRRNIGRELAGYRTLKAAKIMTPELLLTARCSEGSHIVVFEFLRQAQTLGELWRQVERRSEIAAASLELIALLHKRGCNQTDLHFANFLLVEERLYVVDVASVEKQENAEYGKWQRENLALFFAQFTPLWRKTLLDSLALHYAEAAADHKLEEAIERAWQRRKSRYLKKCFRESGQFSADKSWHQMAVWKRAQHSADLVSFLQHPDAWVEKGELLEDGTSATVVRVVMDREPVVIKRNNIKSILHRLSRCLHPTRSHVNWRNAHLLKINGIATPEPIAFVEKRWGLFRLRGYYVCAFNNSPSAAEKYESHPPHERELVWFRELFTGMRLARIYHGDFKASNLLVTDKGIELIHLDSMKECSSQKKMRVLLRKDRRRFLKNWKDKSEQRKLFADILGEE